MQMEIAKPLSAWAVGGRIACLLSLLHTVPSPGRSPSWVKEREREVPTWIWLVGQSSLRLGLVGMAGDLRDITLLITGVWLQRMLVWMWCPGRQLLPGDNPPDRWSFILPHSNGCSVLSSAPSSQGPHSMSSTGVFWRGAENLPNLHLERERSPCGASLIGSSWGLLNKRTCPAMVQ